MQTRQLSQVKEALNALNFFTFIKFLMYYYEDLVSENETGKFHRT